MIICDSGFRAAGKNQDIEALCVQSDFIVHDISQRGYSDLSSYHSIESQRVATQP